MTKKPLSFREKKVLCASLCFPLMMEKEISRMLKIKISTYTIIKRRLRSKGYFKKIRTPCLFKMGYSIFVIIYADISTGPAIDERSLKILLKNLEIGSFSFLSRRHLLVMGFARDYISMMDDYLLLKTFLIENLGVDHVKIELSIFPRKQSAVLNYFNLGPVLADLWEIANYRKAPKIICGGEENNEIPQLTRMGYLTYRTLIAYPTKKDNEISSILKASRQVVNKYKKNFEEKGYLCTLGITDPIKLDLSVLSVRWIKYVDKGKENSFKRMGKVCLKNSQYFMIMGPQEIFTLSLYPDLTTLEVEESRFIDSLKEMDFIPYETKYRIFSLPDSTQLTFFEFKKVSEVMGKEIAMKKETYIKGKKVRF